MLALKAHAPSKSSCAHRHTEMSPSVRAAGVVWLLTLPPESEHVGYWVEHGSQPDGELARYSETHGEVSMKMKVA